MQTGVLTIDILTLNETNVIQDSVDDNGVRTLRLIGVETSCDTPLIDPLKNNIMALMGRIVPVQFQYKDSHNGYYYVTEVNVTTDKWFNGSTLIQWTMSLALIGADNSVDVESRLANIVRANNFSLTGERWHAPAIGHYAYYVGPVSSTTLTRTGANGAIVVYRSIPASVNPRWGAPLTSYIAGRTSLYINSVETISPRVLMSATGWEMNNGLVRIKSATSGLTTLLLAFYDGTAWRELPWDVRVEGDSLVPATHFQSATITRLDHEAVTLRIVAIQPSNSQRVVMDLLLRRGSRFVEGYIQRTASGTISVQLDTLIAFTDNSATGYVVSTANDANGNMLAAGSAKSFTSATNGGVSKTAATTLDFWVGMVKGGTAAVSGDAATDLRNQYIGAMAEKTGVVRR